MAILSCYSRPAAARSRHTVHIHRVLVRENLSTKKTFSAPAKCPTASTDVFKHSALLILTWLKDRAVSGSVHGSSSDPHLAGRRVCTKTPFEARDAQAEPEAAPAPGNWKSCWKGMCSSHLLHTLFRGQ